MRYAISAIAVALTVFACAHPAYASITAASLNTKTPMLTGPCPKTVSFTGSIIGTPGTTFMYSFNRFINGTQQVVNVGSGTIPASSSLPVSDSMTISMPASGRTFDQIWVHNITGGQSDVYSNEVGFTVTCGAPPKPTPKPTPKPYHLPYPTHLKNTVDAKVCGQHGGFA